MEPALKSRLLLFTERVVRMPEIWIQLGVAGATLFILYVFIQRLFNMFKDFSGTLSKLNKNEEKQGESAIEKLCDKIDRLVSSYNEYVLKLNEVIISNDKDQKVTIDLLNTILEISIDSQRRITRVDDRTYRCLGNKQKEENCNEQ